MKKVILKTNKLCKTFSTAGNQQHVLKNLDLEIYEGDFTVIMGASGSGKSTLLYALSGMDQPTLGEVSYKDQDITKMNGNQSALFRRHNCGFVFQQIHLLDNMSVFDNVLASGLLITKDRKKVVQKARELLKSIGVEEKEWGKFPAQLSGGEAQRVGIARALINSPSIVFADEPTGALNSAYSEAVLNTLTQINKDGQSIVAVTHDIKTARRANRVIYLKDGVICGECELFEYQSQDSNRRQKLNDFLTEMGW